MCAQTHTQAYIHTYTDTRIQHTHTHARAHIYAHTHTLHYNTNVFTSCHLVLQHNSVTYRSIFRHASRKQFASLSECCVNGCVDARATVRRTALPLRHRQSPYQDHAYQHLLTETLQEMPHIPVNSTPQNQDSARAKPSEIHNPKYQKRAIAHQRGPAEACSKGMRQHFLTPPRKNPDSQSQYRDRWVAALAQCYLRNTDSLERVLDKRRWTGSP